MAIVAFEFQDLERLGLAKEAIKETVDRLGMSLEELSGSAATIDITANRADMLDTVGFARAASFLSGKKVPKEGFYSIKNGPLMSVKVADSVKRIRPFIAAAVAKNVDLNGNKLKNLINFTEKFCETYGRKRKKIAVGIHNLDVINGNLTYDASHDGEFVPLGSKSRAKFADIINDHKKGIEYSETLGKSRLYPFLRDSKNVLSLIPIINSELTRVTGATKNLLIDITGTSKNAVESAMNMFACSFIDMGADLYPCEIAYRSKTVTTPQLEYKSIRVKSSKVERTIGVLIDSNKIITLANRLGHVAAKYGSYTLVHVPPYRLDVLNEQDIIEDIAIAYGYDKIEPQPVSGFSVAKREYDKEYMNRTARFMLGIGFTEAMNPYLTNEGLNFKSLGREYSDKSVIKIAYAKTESITMLRTELLPWLMQNLGNSANEKMPQRLFEIGSVFSLDNGKVVEATNLAMVSEHSKVNYSEMKSAVQALLKFAGIMDYKLKELNDSSLIKGRAAKIMVGNETAGYFGEIDPKILNNFKLEEPVVAAEIYFEKIQ